MFNLQKNRKQNRAKQRINRSTIQQASQRLKNITVIGKAQ